MIYSPSIEWLIPIISIDRALIFGKMSRSELLRPYQLFNWIFVGVFFAAQSILFYVLFSHESISFVDLYKELIKLFTPELRLERAIAWLHGLYIEFIHYVTPVISMISFTMYGITYFSKRKMTKEAEQATSSNGDKRSN